MAAEAKLDDARKRIRQLHADLQLLVDRDPDQEVWERAVPVLDAVVQLARDALPDDPVIQAVEDFLSAGAIADGRELRAAEALLIVGQIRAAIPAVRPAMPYMGPIPAGEDWLRRDF